MKERGPLFSPILPGVLFALWAAVLWILSSLPGQNVPLPSFPHVDKVVHFGYFLVGGFLLTWWLRRVFGWKNWSVALVAWVVLSGVGALDEIHQLFTPGRSGSDVGDWLADTTGALAGAWIFLMIYVVITRPTPCESPAGD